jgi:hypothetical protein
LRLRPLLPAGFELVDLAWAMRPWGLLSWRTPRFLRPCPWVCFLVLSKQHVPIHNCRVAPPQAHWLHTGIAEIFVVSISEATMRLKYMKYKGRARGAPRRVVKHVPRAGAGALGRAGGRSQPHAALYISFVPYKIILMQPCIFHS